MALRAKSLFLFGLQVTELNRSIDFIAELGGDELQATLTLGYYSLSSLLEEIQRALEAADLDHEYTVTADRTIASGTENRITIASSGTHFELLFSTGTRAGSSVAPLIGFASADQTGATSYQGASSAGTVLVPYRVGNKYIGPTRNRKVIGPVNVSSNGHKEVIIHSSQSFWEVEFIANPEADMTAWESLMVWLISQRPIDFTPEITSPNTFYQGTLESTPMDSRGMSFQFKEFKPGTGLYDTGLLKFRVKE